MPRSKNSLSDRLYDAAEDLRQCEYELSVIAHISGVSFEDIENVTIDEIWSGLKNSFQHPDSSKEETGLAAHNFLRKKHFLLLKNARSLYRKKHMAKWCVQNG